MRSDMLLINMEERARHRSALKTEREARRRAIEDEKLAKVQRKEPATPRAHFLTLMCRSSPRHDGGENPSRGRRKTIES